MTAQPAHGRGAVINWAEFRPCLVWGIALAAAALTIAAVGGWVMTVAVAAMVAIVGREWVTITIGDRLDAVFAVGALGVVVVVLAGADLTTVSLAVAGLGAIGIGFWLRTSWAIAGVVYMASLGIAAVALRADPFFGLEALLFVFAVVWATDSAAYFVGKALGGPKLWPAVSPGKTWSGAIGGAIGGLSAGIAAGVIIGAPIGLALAMIAFGLSIISQAGDLFESAVKRRFGVKDSSNLIPGHGGLMDRVDALIFALGVAAMIGWLHAGWPLLGSGLLLW